MNNENERKCMEMNVSLEPSRLKLSFVIGPNRKFGPMTQITFFKHFFHFFLGICQRSAP